MVPGEGGQHHHHGNLGSSPAPNDKYPHAQLISYETITSRVTRQIYRSPRCRAGVTAPGIR